MTFELSYDDDAAAHEITDAIDWRESYYLNFADLNSALHGVAWQGVRPNMGRGEAVFVLYDGDTPLIHSVEMAVPVAKDIGTERAAAGPQRFDCIEPWRRWDVHYDKDGDKVDLEWTQVTETCDWNWADLTGSKHYQGTGRVSFKGVVGGREISFEGVGERDRAWGPRNYGPLQFSWWMTAQFPDEVFVHAFSMKVEDTFRLHGFLHTDGRTRPLVEHQVIGAKYEEGDGPVVHATQRVTDDEGRTLTFENELVHYLGFGTAEDGAELQERDPGEQKTGRMYLTFQTYRTSDGVEGRGMVDNNRWAGDVPTDFVAGLPNWSTLYRFGLDDG